MVEDIGGALGVLVMTPRLGLDDLLEARLLLEPAAARLAAERATAADLDQLRDALGGMAEAGSDTAAMTRADVAFHRCLLLATHNEFLSQIGRVLEVGLAERDRMVHEANPADDPVPSHRAVYEAISARDALAAEAAMFGLLDKSTTDLSLLAPHPDT
jgi:DNA-binding FadR family transcriptional regulator